MSVEEPTGINPTPNHPLDPLTVQEMELAVSIVRSDTRFTQDSRAFFDRVELSLPNKSIVLNFHPGDEIPRKAFVGIYCPSIDKYYKYTINLVNQNVDVNHIQKARPAWTYSDNFNLYSVIIENSVYRNALINRGITEEQIDNGTVQPNLLLDGRLSGCAQCLADMPDLEGDPENGEPRPRSFYASTCLMDGPADQDTLLGNFYVQPVGNLWIWLDANAGPNGQVLKVVDTGITAPTGQNLTKYNEPPNTYYNDYRHTLKPIAMSMPDGVSFVIDGNLITWERWRFRFQMHPIVGLVLNLIEYNDVQNQTDAPNYRQILYQANLSEAITAYGAESYGTRNFNFLDFGEYQSRLFLTPLEPGIDVPPYASMFHPVFIDDLGELIQWINGLAIYEEDADVLLRHYEYNTGVVQGRRGRRLVLAHANCIGNYDYIFQWKFDLDGKISSKIILSGMDEMEAGNIATETESKLYENLISSNHQHFFNYRLNFSVDGTKNRVSEVKAQPINSECTNSWKAEKTLLEKVGDTVRNVDPLYQTKWTFENYTVPPNPMGGQPGYAVVFNDGIARMAKDKSIISKRAPFMENNLYVTKYKDSEQYMMGEFPCEKTTNDGINIDNIVNQNIVDKDLVAWVTNGISHSPMSSDFPVLLAKELNLHIVPDHFFTMNPALDTDINVLIDPTQPKKSSGRSVSNWRKRFNKMKGIRPKCDIPVEQSINNLTGNTCCIH